MRSRALHFFAFWCTVGTPAAFIARNGGAGRTAAAAGDEGGEEETLEQVRKQRDDLRLQLDLAALELVDARSRTHEGEGVERPPPRRAERLRATLRISRRVPPSSERASIAVETAPQQQRRSTDDRDERDIAGWLRDSTRVARELRRRAEGLERELAEQRGLNERAQARIAQLEAQLLALQAPACTTEPLQHAKGEEGAAERHE
eukprot:m51a1_g11185 hypothetical protein (204) ;mRNA; f:6416-7414